MSKVKGFSVKFIGLKEGTHNFQFPLSKSFFETFEYSEFNSVDINVDLVLVKKSTIIELRGPFLIIRPRPSAFLIKFDAFLMKNDASLIKKWC